MSYECGKCWTWIYILTNILATTVMLYFIFWDYDFLDPSVYHIVQQVADLLLVSVMSSVVVVFIIKHFNCCGSDLEKDDKFFVCFLINGATIFLALFQAKWILLGISAVFTVLSFFVFGSASHGMSSRSITSENSRTPLLVGREAEYSIG